MGDLTMIESSKIDHSSLRTNQALIILGLLVGFVLDVPLIVAIVAFIMLVGTAIGRPGVFFVF
jgi:hypothetical protein